MQVKASLIVVLTRGGSTARLVAKYKPSIPVLTVAVPVLTTDSLTWTCSGEQPARQCLITRGLLPLLAEGSARATDTDTTDEIIAVRSPPCMDVAMQSLIFSSWCILSGDECKLSRALHPAIQDMLCLNQNASEAFSELLRSQMPFVLTLVLHGVQAAMSVAKQLKYCQRGDSVVAVHRIGHSAVIKISEVK